MVAPNKADSATTIKISKFKGRISLLNICYIQGSVDVQADNPQLKFFCWDDNFFFKKNLSSMIPPNFSGQLGFAGLTAQCFNNNDPDCKTLLTLDDKFVNVQNEISFVADMVSQDRDAIPNLSHPPAGSTDVYISRVTLQLLSASACSFQNSPFAKNNGIFIEWFRPRSIKRVVP